MEDFKTMLFGTITEFNTQRDVTIDWTAVWEDEERFETVLDALDALLDGVALLPDIEEIKRIHLLGKLALSRSHLAHCYGNQQQIAHFLKHGESLQNILRDIMNISPWIKMAQDRFEEYVEFEETVTEETVLTQKQLDSFRPILMALALMSIITIDQEDACNDECNDEIIFELEQEDSL